MSEIWLPSGAKRITDIKKNVQLGIIGPSGAGKTHSIRQLGLDPEYAGKVLVLASEDPSIVLGDESDVIVKQIDSLAGIEQEFKDLRLAARNGRTIPEVIVWDSTSGTCDRERDKLKREKGADTYAGYWDLGAGVMSCMIMGRNDIPADVIVLATTTPPPMPELCVDGKMTPKNFTRLTDVCLFITSEKITPEGGISPTALAEFESNPLPYIEVARGLDGKVMGSFLRHIYTTQNTGEVPAKGHHNLNLVEPADLPNLLRKLHGKPTVEWWRGVSLEGR